jgi:putative phosphoesterase
VVLAVIADTHMPRGSRRLPDACRRRLDSADLILHAGDLCTAGVLRELEAHGPVAAVRGNMDDVELQRALPESRIVSVESVRIALVHDGGPAAGRLRRLRARFPDADAVVFGHSHLPLHERGDDGFQVFNPGSPTERRRAPRHTMGMARVKGGAVEFELIELA